MDNLLTVSQYAAAIGISRQAAYKRIADGKLTEYIRTVDGKTLIDGQALAAAEAPAGRKDTDKQSDNAFTIDFLKAQVIAKDKQIEAMQRTIDSLTDALKAAQALHAADKKLLSPAPAAEAASTDATPQAETPKSFWQKLFT